MADGVWRFEMRQISRERRLPDARITAGEQDESRARHRHRFAVDRDQRGIFPANIAGLGPDEK